MFTNNNHDNNMQNKFAIFYYSFFFDFYVMTQDYGRVKKKAGKNGILLAIKIIVDGITFTAMNMFNVNVITPVRETPQACKKNVHLI